MADNVTANSGSGGAVFATDDIGGVHYPISKLGFGALDSVTIVTTSDGLPVAQQGTWNITNISGTVSLPTGAATAANQTTIIGHVDGIEGLLTTIDADTSALFGTVSGSEVQVDVVAALPAGTNAIGKLAANSGVDIGDVDVTSLIPGVGATNLGKAIDTATGATDTGVLLLATRDDALSALTPIEGDNVPLRTDANGALWVIQSGTVTVSGTVTANAGTNLNTSALALETGGNLASAVTALQIIDDWDETDRAKVNPIAGQAGVQGGSGTVTALTQRVVLATDVALPAGTNAIGKLSANSGVDIGDVDVTSIAAGTTRIGGAYEVTGEQVDSSGALTVKRASFSSASTGDQAVIAAVSSKTLRILSLQVIATASTNSIYINDGTAALYGDGTRKIPLDVTGATGPGGFTLPYNPHGWFQTAAVTRPININLGSANGIVAIATYVEV